MTPEASLCSAYRAQAHCYRQAVALAEALPAQVRAGDDPAASLGRVMALLAEVAAVEGRGRPAQDEWVRAGGRPGAELRGVLGEVLGLIEQLARALAEAEQEAAARHARLAPEIDALVRGRALRRAYGFAV
jgi:hypothetical protein